MTERTGDGRVDVPESDAAVGWKWLAAIASLACLVRALYLAELATTPFFEGLFLNAAGYDRLGRQPDPTQPFFQSPLYVGFLRALYELTPDSGRFLTVRLAQTLLGAATAIVTAVAASRLGGRRAGILAGLLVALAGPLVYFDGEFLPTTLATFLLTSSLASVLFASDRPLRWTGAGVLMGLACAARPNFLVVACALGAWSILRARLAPRRPGALARTSLLYAAGLAVPLLVVTSVNLAAGQGFVPLTSSLGFNLLVGNGPGADGLDPFPTEETRRFVEELGREGLSSAEQSRATASLALRHMGAEPGRTAALWARKALLSYNRFEVPNNRSISYQRRASRVLSSFPIAWLGLGLLVPLAAAGLVALRGRPDALAPLLAVVVGVPLSLAPFLTCARLRAPMIPSLAILSGIGTVALATAKGGRGRASLATALVLGGVVSWPDWFGVRDSEFLPLYVNRSTLFRQAAEDARAAGNESAARTWEESALGVLADASLAFPGAALPEVRRGDLHLSRGRPDDARLAYRAALLRDGASAGAHAGLARLARDPQEALRHMRRATEARPHDARLLAELGSLLFVSGELEESVEVHDRALRLLSTDPSSSRDALLAGRHLSSGRLAERRGDLSTAERELRAAVALLPRSGPYSRELAAFLERQGRREEADMERRRARDQP